MRRELVIIGGGGFGREACWLAEAAGWTVLGFLDDDPAAAGSQRLEKPVLGVIGDWTRYSDAEFVVAIGSPRTRLKVVEKMSDQAEPRFATIVHPSAQMSRFVSLREGSLVAAGCILTTDIAIGRHCIIDRSVTVGHDCRLGDFVTIAPLVAVSGHVTMGNYVEVGAGALIRQGISLGEGSMVGMGGVVLKSVGSREVVVGNPARLLKTLAS